MSTRKTAGAPNLSDLDRTIEARRQAEERAKRRREEETEQPAPEPQEAPQEEPQDQDGADATPEQPAPDEAPKPERRKLLRRTTRKPPPRVADAVALTVRVDLDEAAEIDLWVLTTRHEIGATKLDKSDVIRELLRLAREDKEVQRRLVRRYRK